MQDFQSLSFNRSGVEDLGPKMVVKQNFELAEMVLKRHLECLYSLIGHLEVLGPKHLFFGHIRTWAEVMSRPLGQVFGLEPKRCETSFLRSKSFYLAGVVLRHLLVTT